MKYKCDMVRDLMPLCLDNSATEASKQVVVEHMAECNACFTYNNSLNKEVSIGEEGETPDKKYAELAKKIRKKKYWVRFISSLFIFVCLGLSFNYAAGYRFDSQRAADTSGRLNYKSKVLGSYKWKDWVFYFYDSYSCYDVVLVNKTWHGWEVTNTCLNWPKWYEDEGVQMAGALYHWSYDEGIQLFPFISFDAKVKKVEVTIFGKTKATEVKTNELTLITFENSQTNLGNEAKATAYDKDGKPLYTLATEKGYWVWKPVG